MPEKKGLGDRPLLSLFSILHYLQNSVSGDKKKNSAAQWHSVYLASKEICPDICTRTYLFLTEVPENQQKATKMKSFQKRSVCQLSYQQKEAYL